VRLQKAFERVYVVDWSNNTKYSHTKTCTR